MPILRMLSKNVKSSEAAVPTDPSAACVLNICIILNNSAV